MSEELIRISFVDVFRHTVFFRTDEKAKAQDLIISLQSRGIDVDVRRVTGIWGC